MKSSQEFHIVQDSNYLVTGMLPGEHVRAILKILWRKGCIYIVLEENSDGTLQSQKQVLANCEVLTD